MKKFIIISAIILAAFVFMGCASVSTSNVNYFSDGPVTMQKRAEATNTVWLGMFGERNYPVPTEVALENGITKIATVERYRKLGVLGFWTEYTTIVTGE